MRKLGIQGLKGFERLMNSSSELARVCRNERTEVYTTVDLPWRRLSKAKSIHLVDGLFESRNIFYRPPKYKYHDAHFVLTTDIKSMNYLRRIGIESKVYIPVHGQMEFQYDSEGPFLVTTSNTPYQNLIERKALIMCLKGIIEQLTQFGEKVVFRIKDEFILNALRINEENNYLNELPSGLKGMISTPSTLIMHALRNDIPVMQVFYQLDPIFVQSGWMISVNDQITSDYINSFINPEMWRLEFQKNEVLVPLETDNDENIDFDVIKISPNTILLRAIKYFLKETFPFIKVLKKRF